MTPVFSRHRYAVPGLASAQLRRPRLPEDTRSTPPDHASATLARVIALRSRAGRAWRRLRASQRARGRAPVLVARPPRLRVLLARLPARAGRDLCTYLRVYVQLFDPDAMYPQAMPARTPLAPLAIGALLDVGGVRPSSRWRSCTRSRSSRGAPSPAASARPRPSERPGAPRRSPATSCSSTGSRPTRSSRRRSGSPPCWSRARSSGRVQAARQRSAGPWQRSS